MTRQCPSTLVIVFGAGGRLGRVLLPVLAAGPWAVVAVTRRQKPPDPLPAVHWTQVDVTVTDSREQSLRSLLGLASAHDQVIVVDLLLDKSSVTAMRRSLSAGTTYITRLCSCLTTANQPVSLVLASTTAVLAPWLYQTPYGSAKRRQLKRYASAGIPGQAILLPQLVRTEAGSPEEPTRLAWTYDDAAALLARAVAAPGATAPTRLRLVVPHVDQSVRRDVAAHRPSRRNSVAHVAGLHIVSWTSRRNSPAARRLASHGRLELTPGWLRSRIDHHVVPPRLVHMLARKLRVEVVGSGRAASS